MLNYSENRTNCAPLPPLPLLSPTMSTWIVLGTKAGFGNKLPELWGLLVFTYEQNVGELRDEQCVDAPWRSHYVQLGLQHGRAHRPWNMARLLWYDMIWAEVSWSVLLCFKAPSGYSLVKFEKKPRKVCYTRSSNTYFPGANLQHYCYGRSFRSFQTEIAHIFQRAVTCLHRFVTVDSYSRGRIFVYYTYSRTQLHFT